MFRPVRGRHRIIVGHFKEIHGLHLLETRCHFLHKIYLQYTLSCGVNKTYATRSGQNFIMTRRHLRTEQPRGPGTQ
jgi:hypothetical protein